MYKALDIRNNTEIIILDPKWLRAVDQLRQYDHYDFLVCQGCKQPVRVRAGEYRREHFAHKHLENCSYADESTVLHNARAILYEWLVGKFGENVTIEKKVDGINLFRPIDCWVTQGSTQFAYWIFDSTLKPEKRKVLQEGLKKLGAHFNWVFVREILRTEKDHPDKLVLSTTEREFIRNSKYDIPVSRYHESGSLHYLDAENRQLTTFRCLSIYHEPAIYSGIEQTSNLEKISISPQNGEFIHEGEHDKLQKYEQQLKVVVESPNKQGLRAGLNTLDEIYARRTRAETPPSISFFSNKHKCEFCGELTDDWLSYNGKTGLCQCRSCLEQGKF